MWLKYSLVCSLISLMVAGSLDAKDFVKKSNPSKNNVSNSEIDGFINFKGTHERSNNYAFGPKNTSAIAATPVLKFGDFTVEGDVYYGKQFTYTGFCGSKRDVSKILSPSNYHYFFKDLPDSRYNKVYKGLKKETSKGRLYRSYTRGVYNDQKHNFFVVLGDVFTNNTIGFQQTLRGGGIGITRRSPGAENIVNAGLPIAITSLSKLEVRLEGQIIAVVILPPGLYSVDDLPEEAKLPGVLLHISDQLSRSDDLVIDYFSGYGLVEAGKDDFDAVILYDHYYDIDDPFKMKYEKKPRYSANYRYGYNCCTTIYAGIQGYAYRSIKLDYGTSFNSYYGLLSPAISYSYDKDHQKKSAVGASIYYSAPKNKIGVFFEAFFAVKSKGYTSLGKDSIEDVNAFIEKYFTNPNDIRNLKQTSGESSSRQAVIRLYTKPYYGFTPSFIFSGNWSSDTRDRRYTLALSKKLGSAIITCSGGLTYDDPSGGKNQRSPDRRFTLTCAIPVGSDLVVKGTYSYYNDETYRTYGDIEYSPSQIKGFTIGVEDTKMPEFNNTKVTLKYVGEHGEFKVDENIINRYERPGVGVTTRTHKNQQRFFVGTSISKSGMHSCQKNSFHVLRVDRKFK